MQLLTRSLLASIVFFPLWITAQIGLPPEPQKSKDGKMDEQMQMRQAIDEKNNIKAQRQAQEKQRPPAPKPPSKPVAPAPTKAPINLGE